MSTESSNLFKLQSLIKIEVSIKEGKDFYQASGNVVINRKKFGVTYGMFYNPISDNATVSFKINMAK